MDPFEERLSTSWPDDVDPRCGILVACSGGPDSLALLRATVNLGRPARVEVAHFHHGLRGDAADRDMAFVQDRCRAWGCPCHVGHAERTGKGTAVGDGPEGRARRQRYAFLARAAADRGLRYVATGHTADDQSETILHHILRGTGLAGLAGIPTVRALNRAVTLIRPLLTFERSEVMAYLERRGEVACIDETNQTPCYYRNRLRGELLPLLEAGYAPQVRAALRRLGRAAAEGQEALRMWAAQLLELSLLQQRADVVIVDCRPWQKIPVHVRREAFVLLWEQQGWPRQAMGQTNWQRLSDLVVSDASGTAPELPGAIRPQRRGHELQLERLAVGVRTGGGRGDEFSRALSPADS